MDYVWIGVGAALGANARYIAGQFAGRAFGTDFPSGTMLVNISGSILIGVLMTLLSDRFLADPHWRLFLIVGLLGGYTTFSSFSFEVIDLLEQGRWPPAAAYVAVTVTVGLAGCYAGVLLARIIER